MIVKRLPGLAVLSACLWFCLLPTDVSAKGVVVQGTVTNAAGQPVPGVTVSLFHPAYGRSDASLTDAWGRYVFHGVPVHPDPYYIEVYWGNRIIYRSMIRVQGPVRWPVRIR